MLISNSNPKRLMSLFLLGACLVGCSRLSDSPPSETSDHVFVTRRTLEPDKLASIWLIKRFVDRDAKFVFVGDDAPLTSEGIPFDTSEAEFRRYATLSCFESILRKHPVTEPGIERLTKLIHDIEINYWANPLSPDSLNLRHRLLAIVEAHPAQPEACLGPAFAVFDAFLADSKPSQDLPGIAP